MADESSQKRLRPNASRNLVRPDYHRKPLLTYAEAALIAGVKVNTIEKWVCCGKLHLASRVGPYRISAEELRKYLKTGVPQ